MIVDVFTGHGFGGNQLVVFPDADGLGSTEMQLLAREFNFSEAAFVLPARRGGTHAVRIFTPRSEVAFAGHPTLGTAAVLAVDPREIRQAFRFEEAIGVIDVSTRSNGTALHAELTLRGVSVGGGVTPPIAACAAALSIETERIDRVLCAGIGIPFCFIQVQTIRDVDDCDLNLASWQEHFGALEHRQLYVFAGRLSPGARLYARMFAPALGIAEDPATGSAAAALVFCASIEYGPGEFRLIIDQGVRMGRPSVLEASASQTDGTQPFVTIGGRSVILGAGEITRPSPA
jgi:trans-2,3-dihydro-3-hydroxyanthranilate isomerase